MEQTTNTQRANRISVQPTETGFKAIFHRTHKVLGEVNSENTTWEAMKGINRSAQRELFRLWICEHSTEYGYTYDAEDRRESENLFPSRYESEDMVKEWASKIVKADIEEWTAKTADEYKTELHLVSVNAEDIKPVTFSKSGKEVKAQYNNGNWAWADISVVTTVGMGAIKEDGTCDSYGWVTMSVSLVSGQLKKPTEIGDLGYTFTGFKTELNKDLGMKTPEKPETKKESKKSEKSPKKESKKNNKSKKGEKQAK